MSLDKAIEIGNVDVEVAVKVDGKALGKLRFSKGGVNWMPANKSVKSHALSWRKFDELMQAQGRPATTPVKRKK